MVDFRTYARCVSGAAPFSTLITASMAAASGAIPADLAAQVSHCMGQLALPNPPDLKAVEQTLVSLSGSVGFAQAMASIATDGAAVPQQQNLALILLRELSVGEFWLGAEAGVFVVPAAEKASVRASLPNALLSSTAVVRIQAATAMAHIASMDWPEQWPGLLEQLLLWAGGGAPVADAAARAAVQDGALRTLVYFTEHIGSGHVVAASRTIMPRVLALWREVADLATPAKAKTATKLFAVMQGLLSALAPAAHMGHEDAKEVAEDVLPAALAAASVPLASPAVSPTACRVKQAVLHLLNCVLENYAAALSGKALPFVQGLVSFIARTAAVYERVDVAGGEVGAAETLPGDASASGYDSESTEQSLSALGMQSTALLVRMMTAPCRELHRVLGASMPDLLALVMPLMQIPDETLQDWLEDPDAFVAAEEDESLDSSVRGNVLDLCGDAYMEFSAPVLKALADACLSVLAPPGATAATPPPRTGASAAWKMQESALCLLGNMGPQFCYMANAAAAAAGGGGAAADGAVSGPPPLDMDAVSRLLHSVIASDGAALGANAASVPSLAAPTATPCSAEELTTARVFLVGRALWAAGRFAACIPGPLVENFLEACLAGLSPSKPIPLQLAACEAMARFTRLLARAETVPQAALDRVAEQAVDRLLALVLSSSQRTLYIPLVTMRTAMWASPAVTAAHEGKLGPLVLALWLKHLNDPAMHDVMVPCMRSLLQCGVPAAVEAFSRRLLTPLSSVLGNPRGFESGVAESACNVLRGILSAAPAGLHGSLMTLFPLAAAMVSGADPADTTAVQAGVGVLTAFTAHAPAAVAAWRSEGGASGPAVVAQAMVAALQGGVSDQGIMSVPDGVMALVTAGIGVGTADAVALAQALAVRLAATKTATPMLNCVVALAGLAQDAAVVAGLVPALAAAQVPAFRDTVQAAQDRTAGHVVTERESALVAAVRAWLHVMPFVVGSARRNITSMGLVRLLTADGVLAALAPLTVASSVAPPPDRSTVDGYLLRSKSKGGSLAATTVPIPVEVGLQLCNALLAAEAGEDEGDHFWDGEESEEEGGGAGGVNTFMDASELKFFSDMFGADGVMDMGGAIVVGDMGHEDDELYQDGEEEEDDAVWLQRHPWHGVNLVQELRAFLRQAAGAGSPLAPVLAAVTATLPADKLARVRTSLATQGGATP